jgi:hypothetical protein
MFNWSLSQEMEKYKRLNVVTEAPGDTGVDTGVVNNGSDAEDMGSTDYDAAAAEMDDANQDGQADAGTETAENDVEDMEADDYSEDEEGTEGEEATGEEEDLEAEDYDEEGGGDDVEEETPEEEEPVPDENGDKSKNRFLVREYVQLYHDIENIIKKLNNNHKTSLIRSEIYLQVSNNLAELNNVIFEYLKNDFSHKSYLFNLYQFNLFLEFINVNADIMAKCNELQSNEQTNK